MWNKPDTCTDGLTLTVTLNILFTTEIVAEIVGALDGYSAVNFMTDCNLL